ncbi:MAG: glycoside hydrolase domain-containing protein [Novosphingobium sp.]
MQAIVQPATAGAQGFDANTPITRSKALAFKKAGFDFAVRYVTRKSSPPAHDLSQAEARAILEAGLALMAVQHVAAPGWLATPALGAAYGANAANHAKLAGLPKGTALFLDLEEVSSKSSPADVIGYCNSWYKAADAAGYAPGIYVGSNCGLSSAQLYYDLRFKYYWKSGSRVPAIPIRGYSMQQTIRPGDKVAGVAIDRNVVIPDRFGMAPPWARLGQAAACRS